jgi:hypothetical protein
MAGGLLSESLLAWKNLSENFGFLRSNGVSSKFPLVNCLLFNANSEGFRCSIAYKKDLFKNESMGLVAGLLSKRCSPGSSWLSIL